MEIFYGCDQMAATLICRMIRPKPSFNSINIHKAVPHPSWISRNLWFHALLTTAPRRQIAEVRLVADLGISMPHVSTLFRSPTESSNSMRTTGGSFPAAALHPIPKTRSGIYKRFVQPSNDYRVRTRSERTTP
jgi:hypothetical protein